MRLDERQRWPPPPRPEHGCAEQATWERRSHSLWQKAEPTQGRPTSTTGALEPDSLDISP